ncbi:MAG: hypothetical protein OXC82_01205 [Rhodobacteraceae bacterium]|nr:hypothetical protein [Paracoccaceae bacterium]
MSKCVSNAAHESSGPDLRGISLVLRSRKGRLSSLLVSPGIYAQKVVKAAVRHMNETDIRVGGFLRWWHAAGTEDLPTFRMGISRGDVMPVTTGLNIHHNC